MNDEEIYIPSGDLGSGSGTVDSVNGQTGTVVLDADDISAGTTNKYVTAAEKTKLSNLSGTNTGDQTTITGNAGTATALQTARNIDGVSFNGTANISVVAPATHAASTKATPVDADEIPLADSASSFTLKNLTWGNLKATVKAYYDSVSATLTNKTINGSNNTISNIANASLTNSSVTIGSTSVSLGATATTLAGVTLTTPTIASFANAGHDHTNSAGGGQITDAALSSAVTVPKGGSGRTTATTAYGLIAAGTTATGTQQTVSPGSSGQLLKSAGGSALPSFSTVTQDDIGDGTTYKQYSSTEKTKLAGIETAADVTDATNVAAAGATMDADTSLAGNGYFLDEDNMASDSATKVPSQQSVKAFVVASIAASGGGDFSSSTSTSVDGEAVVFSGTGGKTGKRATGTGVAKLSSGVLSAANVVESEITLANNTTNDVSTSRHGFVPIAPNVATQFLKGDGTWGTLSGMVRNLGMGVHAGSTLTTSFVTHATLTATSRGGLIIIEYGFDIGNGISGANRTFDVRVQCDGVDVTPNRTGLWSQFVAASVPYYTGGFTLKHTPSAASHTWNLQFLASAGSAVVLRDNFIKVDEVLA